MRAMIVLLAGCRVAAPFVCDESAQCRAGTCQADGLCTSADAACASGERYADNAGAVAGTCFVAQVPADAAVDASLIDASTFDVAQCPAGFTLTIAARPHARYAVSVPDSYGVLLDACVNAAPGFSHPATVRSIDMGVQLLTAARNLETYYFVGGVQRAGAVLDAGWINFDDTPLDPTLWQPMYPSDVDGTENREAQILILSRATQRLRDVSGVTPHPMLCECDGLPVGPLATATLAPLF